MDGKLLDGKDNNNYLFTDESKTTKLADGVYEYTVTADGLYQIKSAPANVAAGVITTLSGNSVIVNNEEYTLKDSTKIATIDGDDTTVGDKLSKDDLVVLVFDQNGSDKDLTGAFIVNASAEPAIVEANGATIDIDGTDITVTGTAAANAPESAWGFHNNETSYVRFKLTPPAGVTLASDATTIPKVEFVGGNDYEPYTLDTVGGDKCVDVILALKKGPTNKTVTLNVTWATGVEYTYTFDLAVTALAPVAPATGA